MGGFEWYMDAIDKAEKCMDLMNNLKPDELMNVVKRWFEGREVEILVDICQDGLLESAEKDPERIQEFYEYLLTTFGRFEE